MLPARLSTRLHEFVESDRARMIVLSRGILVFRLANLDDADADAAIELGLEVARAAGPRTAGAEPAQITDSIGIPDATGAPAAPWQQPQRSTSWKA